MRTRRRRLSARPAEGSQEEPALPTPGPQAPASRTGRNKCCLNPQSLVLCYGSSGKTIQLIRPLIVTEAFLKTGGVFPPPPPQEVYPSDSLRSGFSFELKNTAAKQNNKSKKNIRPVTRQHPYLTAAPPPRSLLPLFPSRECEGGICLSWGEREISTGELMGRVQELGELSPCCMQP